MADELQGRLADAGTLRSGVAGTSLIHYGATWNLTKEIDAQDEETVAVLVCHGMGQQVRYETISSVARAIRTEAAIRGGTVSPVEVHLSEENDAFLARAELSWKDKDRHHHCVHVYEAYWAPLTEGRVTYWDTIKFLLLAAWNSFRYSLPSHGSKFDRWMFGGRKTLTIGRWGFFLLIGALALLFAQMCLIGYVSIALAQLYKTFMSHPLPAGVQILSGSEWQWWLDPFIGQHVWKIIAENFLVWALLIGGSLGWRNFIVEFVGDVAAYVSPYKDSKFDELRHKIQKVGLDVGKIVYGFGKALSTVPKYKKIVVVGHSLGSVLAYDTLNALINLDNVSGPEEQRHVVERTCALITFGSPLDKTAFIFRMAPDNEQDWIREQLAASVQPLIVSYPLYRPASFRWINIWSRMDIISGSLDYYDDPAVPPNDPKRVQNMPDPQARRPLLAHVQYWGNKLLREQLYTYVS